MDSISLTADFSQATQRHLIHFCCVEGSLFGGEYKGQKSIFVFFVGFYAVEPQNSTKKIRLSKFLDKNKGQVLA